MQDRIQGAQVGADSLSSVGVQTPGMTSQTRLLHRVVRIFSHILEARAANGSGWSEEIAANLLTALTKLAASLKPDTAHSLKACSDDTDQTVRTYWLVSVSLAVIIVPFFAGQLLIIRDFNGHPG